MDCAWSDRHSDVGDGRWLFARYENRPIGEKKRLVGEAVPLGRMGRPTISKEQLFSWLLLMPTSSDAQR